MAIKYDTRPHGGQGLKPMQAKRKSRPVKSFVFPSSRRAVGRIAANSDVGARQVNRQYPSRGQSDLSFAWGKDDNY